MDTQTALLALTQKYPDSKPALTEAFRFFVQLLQDLNTTIHAKRAAHGGSAATAAQEQP